MCEPFTTVPDQGEVMNRTVGVPGLSHLAPGSCKSQGVWTMAVISDAPPCDNGLCLFPLVLFRTNQFRIPYRFYVMLQNRTSRNFQNIHPVVAISLNHIRSSSIEFIAVKKAVVSLSIPMYVLPVATAAFPITPLDQVTNECSLLAPHFCFSSSANTV